MLPRSENRKIAPEQKEKAMAWNRARTLSLSLFGAVAAAAMLAAPPEKDAAKAAVYHCVGFDEPIRNNMHVAKGRVLPLRAKLQADGSYADATVLKAAPQVRVHLVPETGPEVDRTDQIDVRDYGKGTAFVWDAEAHWKFDLGTLKFEKEGKYRAFLIPGDEAEYKVEPGCEVTFLLGGER
jgi:hypothetical protein